MTTPVSDAKRDTFAAALFAALLLRYQQKRSEVLTRLGQELRDISPEARARLAAFVQDRAQKVQTGINTRMAQATADLPDDAAPDQKRAAEQQAQSEIDTYNHTTLMPYLSAWAATQALIDAYGETPSTADPAKSLRDTTLWIWTQNTNRVDDCTDADAASPASYDTLVAITGGPPPVHVNCQCSLDPDGGIAPESAPSRSLTEKKDDLVLGIDLDGTALTYPEALVPIARHYAKHGRVVVLTGNDTAKAREDWDDLGYPTPNDWLVHEPADDPHIGAWKAEQCKALGVTLLIDDFRAGKTVNPFLKHKPKGTLALQVLS